MPCPSTAPAVSDYFLPEVDDPLAAACARAANDPFDTWPPLPFAVAPWMRDAAVGVIRTPPPLPELPLAISYLSGYVSGHDRQLTVSRLCWGFPNKG